MVGSSVAHDITKVVAVRVGGLTVRQPEPTTDKPASHVTPFRRQNFCCSILIHTTFHATALKNLPWKLAL